MNKNCLNCGNSFTTELRRSKFCSISCYSSYRKSNKEEYSRTYFSAGREPWNKGIKGIHLSPKSEFKSGESTTKLPLFSITARRDKHNGFRKFIKVSLPNTWKQYSVWLWEQENGKIPAGYVVHHVNFDKEDDRLENLALVTRAEHARIHHNNRAYVGTEISTDVFNIAKKRIEYYA